LIAKRIAAFCASELERLPKSDDYGELWQWAFGYCGKVRAAMAQALIAHVVEERRIAHTEALKVVAARLGVSERQLWRMAPARATARRKRRRGGA
jgi:hypothetical protein